MKLLTRDFTKREKALMLVLIVVLLALSYYRFVHIPISEATEDAKQKQANLLSQEAVTLAQLNRLKKMSDEVDSLKAAGVTSTQLSYNGSKLEVAYLNDVLGNSLNYTLNFTGVSRTGDQVRRDFTLTFTTETAAQADAVLASLNASPYRIKLNDVAFSKRIYRNRALLEGEYIREYSVTLSATFYETTVGGTPDAGLPADSSAKKK